LKFSNKHYPKAVEQTQKPNEKSYTTKMTSIFICDECDNIENILRDPSPNKGIEDPTVALKYVPGVLLILVGMNEGEYCQKLILSAKNELGSKRIKTFGFQPFSGISQFLAMGDVVVIPQREGFETVGQVPAKLFDAMAMAKPIVTTNVSCLPEILGDCGWIVQPGRSDELAKAISYVLDHPEEAKTKRQKAREKCKEMYSYDAMEERLCGLFKKYK
jgi:glycosyltransferase involved in cell wall biosynthesis